MEEIQLVDICGPAGGLNFARETNGALFSNNKDQWEPFDFNALYNNYYPSCSFTTLAYINDMFYIAGMDEKWAPHLFSSILGGVWEEHKLIMTHPQDGLVTVSGEISRILWDSKRYQIFLVCRNGQLVTLPDCPDCVRICQAVEKEVLDGAINNDEIVLSLADGSEKCLPIAGMVQYKASINFAREKLKQGALLVDLRPEWETDERLPQSAFVAIGALTDWLSQRDKNETLFFICHRGIKSNLAVHTARELGFSHSYSLGGINELVHSL